MIYRKIIIGLLLFGLSCTGSSQTRMIDSLRKNVYAATSNEKKLAAYLDLCEEYQSLNRDSLDIYAPVIRSLAAESNNRRYKSLAELAYANWYYRWGWSDSALFYVEPELAKYNAADEATRDIYFKLARAKAIYHGSKQRYAEALDVLYKILPEAEVYKDTLTTGLVYNTIGSINMGRGQTEEAFRWVRRAIATAGTGERFIQVLAPAFINLGNAYAVAGNNDSALHWINKSLPLCRKIQNLNYTATALRVQSNVYTSIGKFKEAENALLEMFAIRAKTSPISMIADDNLQLADFYAKSGQLDKAIKLCLDNLKPGTIAGKLNSVSQSVITDPKVQVAYLQALAGYYKQAGRLPEYQQSLEKLVDAKDSLYAANSAEAIAALQTRYDVQRKENTILQQKYHLQRKNFLFYGMIVLAVLLVTGGIFLFRNYRKRQRSKLARMMEEEKKNKDEAVKKAEENERVRIASDLHDNLGAYAASMASNLGYIHLSDADDATQTAFRELTNNSNAIISQLNDTIWVLKKEELSLTAISDRIKNFINRIRKSYPDIELEVRETINIDHRLSSSQAFHLYRILQEAVNNALKHSRGKKIHVIISSGDSWQIKVQDDGRGMDSVAGSGNGLGNMKQRAAEAGWQINWKNAEDGGTVVTIWPTTN